MEEWEEVPNAFSLVGKKPARIITVPTEFRRTMLMRERDVLINDIRVKTGCIVVPHWDLGKINQFDIYGVTSGAEEAVAIVNKWISSAHSKSEKAAAWAKMYAFDPNAWYYDQVKGMEEERKRQYMEPRPAGIEHSPHFHRAVIDWPEDLSNLGTTPRDVFGNKLEALDEIRRNDEVWIILLPSKHGLWQIEISGLSDGNILNAQEHYKTMVEQARINMIGVQGALNIILDDSEGIEIILERADEWCPNGVGSVVPRLLYSPMMYERGSFRKDGIHFTQLSLIQHTIVQGLEKIRHIRGCYDFAIRLGCVVLDASKIPKDQIDKTFSKSDFLKAINSRVELMTRRWALNHEIGWEIHRRLVTATDFLEPTKSAGYFGHIPETLKQTRPMFRGFWIFRDPNSSMVQPSKPVRQSGRPAPQSIAAPVTTFTPRSMLVVQVDWIDDEDGNYEKLDPRFYKLAPGTSALTSHLDINLVELGESRAWNFALESMIPISRKLAPPILTGFAERVVMVPNYDARSAQIFARWNLTPTIKAHLVNGRLDKIYSFGIKNTNYKVELAAMWYPKHTLPVWGMAMRHMEWATHLAELENLSVGCKAEWGDTLTKFLPDDGLTSSYGGDEDLAGMSRLSLGPNNHTVPPRDGIRILVRNLMHLSEIVSLDGTEEGGVRC